MYLTAAAAGACHSLRCAALRLPARAVLAWLCYALLPCVPILHGLLTDAVITP